jgi:hypothetical protein
MADFEVSNIEQIHPSGLASSTSLMVSGLPGVKTHPAPLRPSRLLKGKLPSDA